MCSMFCASTGESHWPILILLILSRSGPPKGSGAISMSKKKSAFWLAIPSPGRRPWAAEHRSAPSPESGCTAAGSPSQEGLQCGSGREAEAKGSFLASPSETHKFAGWGPCQQHFLGHPTFFFCGVRSSFMLQSVGVKRKPAHDEFASVLGWFIRMATGLSRLK